MQFSVFNKTLLFSVNFDVDNVPLSELHISEPVIYNNGWKLYFMPFEIEARGFVCNSLKNVFSKLDAGSRVRRRVAADATTAASHSSAWI